MNVIKGYNSLQEVVSKSRELGKARNKNLIDTVILSGIGENTSIQYGMREMLRQTGENSHRVLTVCRGLRGYRGEGFLFEYNELLPVVETACNYMRYYTERIIDNKCDDMILIHKIDSVEFHLNNRFGIVSLTVVVADKDVSNDEMDSRTEYVTSIITEEIIAGLINEGILFHKMFECLTIKDMCVYSLCSDYAKSNVYSKRDRRFRKAK